MTLAESVDTQLATIRADVRALRERVDVNHTSAEAHRAHQDATLTALVKASDEWGGIRKMLAAIETFLMVLAALTGAAVGYMWHR